jgi:hypothetical protein
MGEGDKRMRGEGDKGKKGRRVEGEGGGPEISTLGILEILQDF